MTVASHGLSLRDQPVAPGVFVAVPVSGCHGLTRRASRALVDGYRKRFRRIEVSGAARFLTFSCYQRKPFLQDPGTRDILARQLFLACGRVGFRLVAWVIMPKHVHLVIVPGTQDVSRTLLRIKRPVSTVVLKQWRKHDDERLAEATVSGVSARFWQAGGGYDRVIYAGDELREKVAYIHANPVRRGLIERPDKWMWSSARAWARLETPWPMIDWVA